MSTEKDKRIYRILHCIVGFILRLVYWVKYEGVENVPEGTVLVCGNHSSWADPFLIAIGIGRKEILHMMAKVELFKNKLLAFILRKMGAFPIDRSGNDTGAVKTAMRYLKSGEKVGIFPEGTRSKQEGDVEAKVGAVKIAEITKSPIVPVYVPRDKKLFKRFVISYGKPYIIPKSRDHSKERYEAESRELMRRISELKEGK